MQHSAATSAARSFRRAFQAGLFAVVTVAAPSGLAAPCWFEAQGEGRVVEVIDGRSFRLNDGREIRLAGIEPVSPGATSTERTAVLSAMIAGRDVFLRGADDTPDRYGRQSAFVFLAEPDPPVQILLLADGAALASADIADSDCASALFAAERRAKDGKKGVWGSPAVTKNAESAGDIAAEIGRFSLVEGRVLSVRQAGATTYLNFGRRWTQDFAVTISRRNAAMIKSAGITLKALENRRIRVRGWVEVHSGPRIEVVRAGQIEVLGGN